MVNQNTLIWSVIVALIVGGIVGYFIAPSPSGVSSNSYNTPSTTQYSSPAATTGTSTQ